MKKLLFTLTLSIALALGSPSAFAQAKKKPAVPAEGTKPAETVKPAEPAKTVEAAKGKAAEAAKPDRPIPYSGDVASVDAKAKTITLKAKDPTKGRTFQVLDSTTIVSNANGAETPAKLSDVKADAYITGTYKKTDSGKLEAVKVTLGKTKTVRAAKGATEKKPDAPATPSAK